jgi:UDP-3-O-acyl-N-acetylglucosamine deacetylase
VEAYKAGHALHTQLVSQLLADRSLWTITTQETMQPEIETRVRALAPLSATD